MSEDSQKFKDEFNWKRVKINESFEDLMNIDLLGLKEILVEPYFVRNGYKSASYEVLVRESIFEKMLDISFEIPNGYKIKIIDGWRSKEFQNQLFEEIKNKYIKDGKEINWKFNKVIEDSNYEKKPALETTGGSICVILLDENGENVDMGTEVFDYSYKSNINNNFLKKEIKENRKILKEIFEKHGFVNNTFWWKYDFGTQFWAKNKNCDAIYGYYEKK